jgi:hsp70-interacting protein
MSQPNWLGLLKWSLAHQDGTSTSQFSEMSEEDKAWLERVMKEAVKDEPQRINEIMQYMKELLSRGDQSILESEQEKIEIQLEELRDIIEQIDMAQIFTKFGGCEILLSLLTFAPLDSDNKAVAAAAIGTATQNNLATQDILYQKHFLSSLVPIFLQTKTTLLKNKVCLLFLFP